MTTTFNTPVDTPAREAGPADGAAIFRRLERRRRRSLWMVLLPFAVFAAFALSGLLIFEGMISSSEPPAQAAPIAPRVVAAPVAAATPAAASTRPAHHHRRVPTKRGAIRRAAPEAATESTSDTD
jgi:hypothetical protein